MNLLLDTQAFLYFIAGDRRLSRAARTAIEDHANELFFSPVSGWEIVSKHAKGRLEFVLDPERLIQDKLAERFMAELPVRLAHTLFTRSLPAIHADPIDRILIAQSSIEGLPLVTGDKYIQRYGVEVVW